jgi:hypothetical protein
MPTEIIYSFMSSVHLLITMQLSTDRCPSMQLNKQITGSIVVSIQTYYPHHSTANNTEI